MSIDIKRIMKMVRTTIIRFTEQIRKYGWDSFKYEILNTMYSDTIEDLTNKLDSLEIYYIGQYDSYKVSIIKL